MSTPDTLHGPDIDRAVAPQATGEVVALPFVHLETVLKTVIMLREFPDQSILDVFNRGSQDP